MKKGGQEFYPNLTNFKDFMNDVSHEHKTCTTQGKKFHVH